MTSLFTALINDALERGTLEIALMPALAGGESRIPDQAVLYAKVGTAKFRVHSLTQAEYHELTAKETA